MTQLWFNLISLACHLPSAHSGASLSSLGWVPLPSIFYASMAASLQNFSLYFPLVEVYAEQLQRRRTFCVTFAKPCRGSKPPFLAFIRRTLSFTSRSAHEVLSEIALVRRGICICMAAPRLAIRSVAHPGGSHPHLDLQD
jgi:hypothetical protein